jgi:hypothetical protein
MLKRILTGIMMTCFLPAMTHAASWSLSTWARTAGGTIQVGNAVPRTSLQGNQISFYSTVTPVTVTVTPNAGYVTSQVSYNGTITVNPTETTYIATGPNAQTVYAWFAIKRFSITSSVVGNIGGTVNPAAIASLTPGLLTSAKVITFTPTEPSFTVNISGIPSGALQSPAVPGAGQSVTVTFPVGFNITSNIALTGTFSSLNPVAIVGSPQTTFTSDAVVLDGSGSLTSGGIGISSYLWSQIVGPTVTLSNADSTQARFIPTAAGTYRFSLALQPGGSTASTTVTVFESLPAFVRDQCYNCHSAAEVGVASNVFGNWSSSGHKTKGVACSQCHVGANTGGHPGKLTKNSVNVTTFDFTSASSGSGNFCVTCHSPAIITDFAASKHSIRAGSTSCGFCHSNGVHNPSAACTECHKTDNTYGLEWPPAAFTFHSSFTGSTSVCKGCHTTHNPKVLSIKTSCP